MTSMPFVDSKASNNMGYKSEYTAVAASEVTLDNQQEKTKRGVYFWFTFLAICVSLFMSAVEVVSV